MRRSFDPKPLLRRRSVIRFQYPDAPAARRNWWLVVEPTGDVDLCLVDPGSDVDLYVSCDLRTMTAIWMGHDTVRAATASRLMLLTGNRQLQSDMQTWLGLSAFAKVERVEEAHPVSGT